ncbi:hypothetical protein B0H10DRAFT_2227387 [Mycena sp. CBHHK59/15]|nr:hypothetical protein B0H10DRAFT_2227387 [Mycena sp. CBHHK59/15]
MTIVSPNRALNLSRYPREPSPPPSSRAVPRLPLAHLLVTFTHLGRTPPSPRLIFASTDASLEGIAGCNKPAIYPRVRQGMCARLVHGAFFGVAASQQGGEWGHDAFAAQPQPSGAATADSHLRLHTQREARIRTGDAHAASCVSPPVLAIAEGTSHLRARTATSTALDGGSDAESTLMRRRLCTRAPRSSADVDARERERVRVCSAWYTYGPAYAPLALVGLGFPSADESSNGSYVICAVVLSGASVGDARRLTPGDAVDVSETEAPPRRASCRERLRMTSEMLRRARHHLRTARAPQRCPAGRTPPARTHIRVGAALRIPRVPRAAAPRARHARADAWAVGHAAGQERETEAVWHTRWGTSTSACASRTAVGLAFVCAGSDARKAFPCVHMDPVNTSVGLGYVDGCDGCANAGHNTFRRVLAPAKLDGSGRGDGRRTFCRYVPHPHPRGECEPRGRHIPGSLSSHAGGIAADKCAVKTVSGRSEEGR